MFFGIQPIYLVFICIVPVILLAIILLAVVLVIRVLKKKIEEMSFLCLNYSRRSECLPTLWTRPEPLVDRHLPSLPQFLLVTLSFFSRRDFHNQKMPDKLCTRTRHPKLYWHCKERQLEEYKARAKIC